MRKLYDTFFLPRHVRGRKNFARSARRTGRCQRAAGAQRAEAFPKKRRCCFFGSFIAALFCAHDETCHECSYFVMPDKQLCLERGAFLRYHIYIVHGRRFPRRSKRKAYPRLTRTYTPDGVRRSSRRSVSAFRRKLHYAHSFFLFPCKPASLGFARRTGE